MKLYGSYGETDLLDAIVWRTRKGWGVCVPVTWKRILFVIVRGHKVESAQLVWRRRADAVKAALAKAPR